MRFAFWAGALALFGIAGCAPGVTTTSAPGAATARSAPSGGGSILSMRRVPVHSDPAPWRAALLADARGKTTAGNDSGRELSEFIIRTDGGSIISVVQANASGFRSGERVVMLNDGYTHIARPG
jgi:outer membrane lipoprotein SlyB